MADGITVEVRGLKETCAALRELGPQITKVVLRKALQAGTFVLGDAVKRATPTKSGLTKESVGTLVRINETEEAGIGVVGFGKYGYRARLVEMGHRILAHGHSRSFNDVPGHEIGYVPAHAFIRPAFDAAAEDSVLAFAEAMKDGINAIAEKVGGAAPFPMAPSGADWSGAGEEKVSGGVFLDEAAHLFD